MDELTYTILDVQVPQPEIPQATPKPDRGKGKVTKVKESPKKIVKASTKVHPDLDALAYMEIEERKEKATQVAKLMAPSKHELIKVVHEEATKAGVDPKHLQARRFGDFGVTELDELGPIIQKKKNKVVGELVTSLGKRYDRLKVIPKELGINPTLPAPGKVLSLTSGRKRKHQELEPEFRIPGLK
ncbi:hypothetical protein Tco_0266897 [Tanacetum coccineum]